MSLHNNCVLLQQQRLTTLKSTTSDEPGSTPTELITSEPTKSQQVVTEGRNFAEGTHIENNRPPSFNTTKYIVISMVIITIIVGVVIFTTWMVYKKRVCSVPSMCNCLESRPVVIPRIRHPIYISNNIESVGNNVETFDFSSDYMQPINGGV